MKNWRISKSSTDMPRFIQKLYDVGTIDNSIEAESFPARRRMG